MHCKISNSVGRELVPFRPRRTLLRYPKMIIDEINLANFGRHEALTFKSDAPVVGLLGVNGVGKSTVLDALEYAITGETRDPIDSYVRHGEGNAQVNVRFRKNGRPGRIFRQFGKSPKRVLEWDGQEIKSAKAVDATLAEIFGADKKAIANAVFINQGMLEAILFKEGDRREMFIKLVNMSFCAQRAKMLEGKIKKLAATVVDLGPTLAALTAQRQMAWEALQRVNEEVAGMRDYRQEIEFCERFLSAEDQRNQVTGAIGNRENDRNTIEAEMDRLLQVLKVSSLDEAHAFHRYLKDQASKEVDALNQYEKVVTELGHYDRVSREVTAANSNLQACIKALEEANPKKQTLQEVSEQERVYREQVEAHNYRKKLSDSHVEWTVYQKEAEKAIQRAPVPKRLEPDIEQLNKNCFQLVSTVSLMQSLLDTQDRIAKCLGDKVSLPEAKCPDCGLKLADPSQLSSEKLAKARESLGTLRTQIETERKLIAEAQKILSDYRRLIGGKQEAIKQAQEELEKIRIQSEAIMPTIDVNEARETHAKLVKLTQTLPFLEQNVTDAKNAVLGRMNERSGFLVAMANLSKRGEFTVEIGNRIRAAVSRSAAELEEYETPYQSLKNSNSQLEQNQKQYDELVASKNLLEKRLEEKMPDEVQNLAIALSGNIAQIRVELSARNEVLSMAKGRQAQANTGYNQVDQEYQEMLKRIESDKALLVLIEDLKLLKAALDDGGLPMAVVRYHFVKLAALTQECLLKLDANFAIMVDSDHELSFKFVRLDEPVQYEMSMNKLSGGQRVRLCVAFLMAVQKHLVSEVGLLVLDEPSVHVDPQGVESLAEFLRSLHDQLQNTEVQVWCSDHNPALENCFSRSLKLT